MNIQTLVVLILSFLLILAIVAIAFLLYLTSRTKSDVAQQAENKFLTWQRTKLEQVQNDIRMQSQQDALKQLEGWRTAEIENVRKELKESVQNEMKVEFEKWKFEFEKIIRKDAASKSQSTLVGKITEHFIPYLPEFSFSPQDARFLGSPVDFIVFDGLSEGQLRKIIFVEVKTNMGSLSTRERQIRDILNNKNVEWVQMKRKLDISPEIDSVENL